jgi:hypothetical protein
MVASSTAWRILPFSKVWSVVCFLYLQVYTHLSISELEAPTLNNAWQIFT